MTSLIYFDSNKQAYTYPVENYIATVEKDVWLTIIPNGELGIDYDIINGTFVDLRQTEEGNKRQVEKKRKEKNEENDLKVHLCLEKTFEVEVSDHNVKCTFVYNKDTKDDLNSSALGFITGTISKKQWTDEDGNTVFLTQEDVANVLLIFNAFGNAVWDKWGIYKKQIEEAATISDLENIEITYDNINS